MGAPALAQHQGRRRSKPASDGVDPVAWNHDELRDGAPCPRYGHDGGSTSSVGPGRPASSATLGFGPVTWCSISERAPVHSRHRWWTAAPVSSPLNSIPGGRPSSGNGSQPTTSPWLWPTRSISGCRGAPSGSCRTHPSPSPRPSCGDWWRRGAGSNAPDIIVPWHTARRWATGDAPGAGRWLRQFEVGTGRALPRSAMSPPPPNGVAVLVIARRPGPGRRNGRENSRTRERR